MMVPIMNTPKQDPMADERVRKIARAVRICIDANIPFGEMRGMRKAADKLMTQAKDAFVISEDIKARQLREISNEIRRWSEQVGEGEADTPSQVDAWENMLELVYQTLSDRKE